MTLREDIRKARSTIEVGGKPYTYYQLSSLDSGGLVTRLPYLIKILLEAALRKFDGISITEAHIHRLANWAVHRDSNHEVPFMPARILLHDTTGLPALVDLAAMREAMKRMGGDVSQVNPQIPVDLVIDHSVTVDYFGSPDALKLNEQAEMKRNMERFRFFRWAQQSMQNLRIIPPSTGIMHQINMEYLSSIAAVQTEADTGERIVFPDSLVGTDSHTTMINGMGVVAWGVGGIEANAAILGQPLYFVTPEVIGFKLTGSLPDGATSTDLALTLTHLLRSKGVVGKMVEFFGPGLQSLSVADRATVSNMAPEYGATMGYFPVDAETLAYYRLIGRDQEQVDLIEAYYKAQGMFLWPDSPDAVYSEVITFDLSEVTPCVAGPKRPQDRIPLSAVKETFLQSAVAPIDRGGYGVSGEALTKSVPLLHPNGEHSAVGHGSVVLTAITSCTNTSNPTVLIGAGLVAKKAAERGLKKPPYVKSSFTPGSRVVTDYLAECGLLSELERFGFHIAGYGCATCIGNSGPLPAEVSQAITEHDLVAAAVLSGNRNFEGRVHPEVKANFLASPPLVVAYALAGRVDIDFEAEPIGYDTEGMPVYLKDLWPSSAEIQAYLHGALRPKLFRKRYANVLHANEAWNAILAPEGQLYEWEESSTYVQEPPFLQGFSEQTASIGEIGGARVLALLGDSVTTDHLSPSGSIKANSPAGLFLQAAGVKREDFNSYPSRRGNHKVMMRGAFANVRIRNKLVPGTEGGVTVHLPTDEVMSIYDASAKYQAEGTNLAVIAGKEYGTGSSRDWAAKGPYLLGVKMIIAESFERIHRSNLALMGVLPLQFAAGTNAATLGITGRETFTTSGLSSAVKPGQQITVTMVRENGDCVPFPVIVRLDSVVDIDYYRNGGIAQTVLRRLLQKKQQ